MSRDGTKVSRNWWYCSNQVFAHGLEHRHNQFELSFFRYLGIGNHYLTQAGLSVANFLLRTPFFQCLVCVVCRAITSRYWTITAWCVCFPGSVSNISVQSYIPWKLLIHYLSSLGFKYARYRHIELHAYTTWNTTLNTTGLDLHFFPGLGNGNWTLLSSSSGLLNLKKSQRWICRSWQFCRVILRIAGLMSLLNLVSTRKLFFLDYCVRSFRWVGHDLANFLPVFVNIDWEITWLTYSLSFSEGVLVLVVLPSNG